MINFIHFATKASFLAATLGTEYTNDSIVFIKDSQEIWAHGQFYSIPDTYKNKIEELETAVSALEGDISDFVKDGMLESAEFKQDTHTLILTFNTDSGKEPVNIDLSPLVDVYDGSNLKLKNVAIPTEDATEPTAEDTVDTAVANLVKRDRELEAAIEAVESSVEAAKGGSLDLIEKGTDGDFVTTTITEKADHKQAISVAVKTDVAIENATEENDGLATAAAVKAYVQDMFTWVEY